MNVDAIATIPFSTSGLPEESFNIPLPSWFEGELFFQALYFDRFRQTFGATAGLRVEVLR